MTPAANLHGAPGAMCHAVRWSAKVRATSTMSSRLRRLSAAAMESQSRQLVCKIFPAIRMRHRSFTGTGTPWLIRGMSGNVRAGCCRGARYLRWALFQPFQSPSHSSCRDVAAAQQKLPAVTQQTTTIKRTAPMAALVSVGPKQGKVGE